MFSDAERYLNLLESCLLGTIYQDPPKDPWNGVVRNEQGEVVTFGKAPGVLTISEGPYQPKLRENGLDWPATAHTMIGRKRMQNIRKLLETILFDGIAGDLIEAGVWRGGACIYMRGILEAWLVRNRRVIVADSFAGLPPPTHPEDKSDWHHVAKLLAVPLEEVKRNFEAYGLLDRQVVFLQGLFKDTLPTAPIGDLALIRLDGDMFESTMDGLVHLYDKLSSGGFVIIDDYRAVRGCQNAVTQFRELRGVAEPLQDIDGLGAYWRKS